MRESAIITKKPGADAAPGFFWQNVMLVLFGQNQFVLRGEPQPISHLTMLDNNFARVIEQIHAHDAALLDGDMARVHRIGQMGISQRCIR